MRWLLLVTLTCACGTSDMLEGLACATDADCLGYFCTAGRCEPAPTSCPGAVKSTYCGGHGVPGMPNSVYFCNPFRCGVNAIGVTCGFRLVATCTACGTPPGGGPDQCLTST